MRRDYYYIIGIGAIFIGLIIWLYVANRSLRQDNREEKAIREKSAQREKRLSSSLDSLMISISQRDKEDSIRAIRDSTLTVKLKALENSNIVTINENHSIIKPMPVNEFLVLVTGYIDSAEGKATH